MTIMIIVIITVMTIIIILTIIIACEGGEGGHVQVLHNQTGKSDGKGSVSEIDDDQMHEDNKVGDNHDDDRDQYVLLPNFHRFVIL